MTVCAAMHPPLGFGFVAPGLILCENLHAPRTRTILVLFPDPCDSTAVSRTSHIQITSRRVQERHQCAATWHMRSEEHSKERAFA